jgi:hypothetical protein
MFVLAGCGQSAATPTPVDDDNAEGPAAVLAAYRDYGGTITAVDAANPSLTTDVTNVVGTIPVFDITQGNPPCAGFVQAVPSSVFTLAADGGTLDVAFTTTTLILVAEGEDIICDEKAPVTMTPELNVQQPKAGRYGVWVGRTDMQQPINGKLTVTLTP